MLKKMILFVGMLGVQAFTVGAQTLTLEVGTVPAVTGTIVEVPVLARNFNAIASFQFALTWDAGKITLVEINDWQAGGVVAGVSGGQARFSWFSASGQGATLADGASLVVLSFQARGCPGDSARVVFDTAQVPIEFTQVSGGQLQAIPAEVVSAMLPFRPPALLPVQDTFICVPGTLSLQASCAGCIGFLWSDGSTSPTHTFVAEGHYAVAAENADGCLFSDSLRLEADTFELPGLPDTAVCPGTPLAISAEAGYPRYEWSTGDTLPAILATGPGEYAVTVVNARGCMASDTVQVAEKEMPLAHVFADAPVLCPGDSTRLQADAMGAETAMWLDAGGNIVRQDADAITVAPDSTTTYRLVARNACGTDTAHFELEVIHFEASAGADTCIAKGSKLQLNASGGAAYRWLDGEYPVDDPHIPNPTAQPADSAFFFVEIAGPNGCTATDSVFVAVADDPLAFIQPINLITPNGDGKNDALYFPNLAKFTRNRLTVWNRWGTPVFQKENYQIANGELWEGTHNGRPLPEGDYYYVLEIDGQAIRQHLMIIRE